MDEQVRLPTSAAGRLLLTDWMIGVVDDASSAEQCARALESAGFAAHDICIVPPATALQQLTAAQWQEEHERVFAVTFDRRLEALREGAPARDAFEAQAAADHTVIGVYVTDEDQLRHVLSALGAFPVHDLYVFWPSNMSRLR